jgi:hypothetical protein
MLPRVRGARVPISSALALALLIAAACAPAAEAPSRPSGAAPALQAVLVASELTVGEQRVPVGVLDRNTPVTDATVHLRAYRQIASDPMATEADAPFKGEGLLGKGVYVAPLKFATSGRWILEVTARRGAGQPVVSPLAVNVLPRPTVPAVGDPAPLTRNLTARDVADVRDIDSGSPPNDMHDLSIADAVAQHRPTLVVFATPAFCTSAMCGPEVHAVQALEPAYRDRLAFIHVEIYQDFRTDPAKRRFTPAVQEWRLQSEPWVFLIDARGIIRSAFEGPAATDELRGAIDRMLGSQ